MTLYDREDLVLNLKIFPGHRGKVLALFEKIKRIFSVEIGIYLYTTNY